MITFSFSDSLVLDDDWAEILVDPEGVDPAAMGLARHVFGCKERHAEKGVEVLLHEGLEGLFDDDGLTLKLDNAAGRIPERA